MTMKTMVKVCAIALAAVAASEAVCATRDAKLEERVDAVLSRLTQEQKIGQLWQCREGRPKTVASEDMSGGGLDPKFLADVREGKIGSLIGKRGVSNYNAIQRAAMEGVGVPLLIGHDMIHSAVTCYPIPLALSCAWDESLWQRIAAAIAPETLALGCNWTFTPMLDVAFDARWGRIAEGGGSDPLVTGLMGAAMVRGFQGEDMSDGLHIAACAKHYVCYGAATGGRDYNAVELSDGVLRDTYLPPFKMAVDAGVATIMPAFHAYNGVPCSANQYLLRDILRGEFGFDGMTISDYNAVLELIPHGVAADKADAAAQALAAGIDMEMVSDCYPEHLANLVKSGRVSQKMLDDAVRNVIRAKLRLGLFDHPEIDEDRVKAAIDPAANRALAREAARKSTVLLKNVGDTLPLKPGAKVALIGDVAASDWQMLGCWSTKDLSNFENATLLAGLKADGVDVSYAEAYTLTGRVDVAAVKAAVAGADVVVAAFGDYWEKSGEGNSSAKIELPGEQLKVAEAVKACGKPLVAVVFGGRPMAIPELSEMADAVLMAWNPGGCGGWGVADVMTGLAEPWGRLTVDMPRASGCCPLFYSRTTTGREAVLNEKNPFGRAYTSRYNDVQLTALYPFGFGLAYTTFAYAGESATVEGDEVVFSADVTNTGARKGSELVQVYVRDLVAKTARPRRQLKGFKRVELAPGETKRVEIRVPVASLGYSCDGRYAVEPGDFSAWIAPNSDGGKTLRFTIPEPFSASAVSPDGRSEIVVRTSPLRYEVRRDGKTVVAETEIGLSLSGVKTGECKVSKRRTEGSLDAPFYKKSAIDLAANETFLDFGEWGLRLAARDDGVAYRFESMKPGAVRVDGETGGFTVPDAAVKCWLNFTTDFGLEETVPVAMAVKDVATEPKGARRLVYLPFVYDVGGVTVAVVESDVRDYPNEYLVKSAGGGKFSATFQRWPIKTARAANDTSWRNRLEVEKGGRWIDIKEYADHLVETDGTRTFPWRVFILADEAAKLCESDAVAALASPAAEDADFSWVKPGKVAWDWWSDFDNMGTEKGCTTANYERFIDFAAANGIEYVILDEGWSERLDIWKFHPRVDVPHLIDYGRTRGVGIILWMAWAQIVGEEARVAEHFAALGAKGFKVDFMDRADAECQRFLWKFAEECAKNKMLIDYHGANRPSGMSRAFPNVLNYEGIHGLECMKFYKREDFMANDVMAFFLRMTAGPLDYTPGAMDNYPVGGYKGSYRNPGSMGTRCRQMAMMALYEAPLQMLCDSPTKYEANKECFAFMSKVPTVWDETVGLGGSPDTFAAVARKAKDGAWYVVAIGGSDACRWTFDTRFLGDGCWRAEVFRDAPAADADPQKYVHETFSVSAGDVIPVRLAKGGGFAARFVKE